jgi:putative NADPH-quinone reductase
MIRRAVAPARFAGERSMARIVVVQGHPDPAGGHLGHALADAYAEGAIAGGHAVDRVEVARLAFPWLESKREFENGTVPPALAPAQAAIGAADHLVLFHPLWLGAAPAILKAFLEQVIRPGFAFDYRPESRFPRRRLLGKSARIVVTMGMPALAYRWWFGAHGLKNLKHDVLGFAGIRPVRDTLFGMVETADAAKRGRWLATMRRLGAAAR